MWLSNSHIADIICPVYTQLYPYCSQEHYNKLHYLLNQYYYYKDIRYDRVGTNTMIVVHRVDDTTRIIHHERFYEASM